MAQQGGPSRGAQGEIKKPLSQQISEGWHAFHLFVWNPEKKEFIGRTGTSCAKITLFYVCFYTCLAGFWVALFAIFYQTISQEQPTYNSLITPPGLNLVPFLNQRKDIEYGLADGDVDRMRFEAEIRENVFQVLDRDQTGFENCEDLSPDEPIADRPKQRFCRYDSSLLGPCAPDNPGYNTTEPCLYMNLNKVWGWVPTNYKIGIPDELIRIREELRLNGSITNRIIVTCVKLDKDNKVIYPPIDVYPREGISFGHYPYVLGTDKTEQARYIRPIVAAKVKIDTFNEREKIRCQAWAANLDEPVGGLFHSRSEPARFSIGIMIRNP